MLNIFRQRRTLVKGVFGAILLLVALSMVITLIPGLTGGMGDTVATGVVAEIAGERITEFDVQQSVQQVSTRNRIPPEMMPFYTSQILNEMIVQKASLREAGRLGLKVDQPEVQAQLRRDQTLFPNGTFVGMQQYEDMIYERTGMTVPQFEERYRQALLLDKLRQLVTDSITATPADIHQVFVQDNEKVVLDYVTIDPADFKKEINPSEGTLQEYFNKNKDRYQIPEKRRAKVLLIKQSKLREGLTVSDEEIRKYYQAHVDNYRLPERVTVRHILLKADSKDPAQVEAAKKKVDDLLKQLKSGADFADLAKKNSQDTGTASTGGLLANITRRQMVPEFEQAAFSLAPNQLSGPVQTMYGIHIIQGISHEQAHQQTFEQAKSQIQPVLVEEKLNKLIADSTEAAAQELSKSPGNIQQIAEKYHAQVVEPAPFSNDENLPNIGASPAFMQQVFGMEKNQVGSPVQVDDGYGVPVLLDILPAHPAEWAEVKDQVKNDYIEEQARGKAAEKALAIASTLDQQGKDKDLKKAAKSAGLTVKTSPAVTREGTIPSLGNVRDLDPRIFTLPVRGTGGPLPAQGLQVVYQIASREAPNEQEFASKKTQVEQKVLAEKRQLAFEIFQDNLKKKYRDSGDLKLHQDAITRLTSANAPRP
ncbi:MAG: peptidyl-prolyl cis-trans isomerase [Acidobacteria bacterium]|nr:peptidyl-prolyl cis-trans isomerase [Acidobacteriota bacterium]